MARDLEASPVGAKPDHINNLCVSRGKKMKRGRRREHPILEKGGSLLAIFMLRKRPRTATCPRMGGGDL
jgi:hypothetical protein